MSSMSMQEPMVTMSLHRECLEPFEIHEGSVVRTANSPLSPLTRPIATPATGLLMGTPASMRDRVLPQTLAIEVLPLELNTSDTSRMV